MALLKACRPYPYVNHVLGGIPEVISCLENLDERLKLYATPDELVSSLKIKMVRSKIKKQRDEMMKKWNLCIQDMKYVCESKQVAFDEFNPPLDWRICAKFFQGAVWSDTKCEHGRRCYDCTQCEGK